MKRIALVVALVVMAVGACKKAQQSGGMAADTTHMAADTTKRMADSMKMTMDTTHRMADTSKAHADTTHARRPARRPATTRRP